MNRRTRREMAFLAAAALAALSVGGFGLHRAGLYALPGDRIVVWFDGDTARAAALHRIGAAGAVLSRIGPMEGMYRVYVLDTAAPRRLAGDALILREPIDGLAQCFGIDTGGPGTGASVDTDT